MISLFCSVAVVDLLRSLMLGMRVRSNLSLNDVSMSVSIVTTAAAAWDFKASREPLLNQIPTAAVDIVQQNRTEVEAKVEAVCPYLKKTLNGALRKEKKETLFKCPVVIALEH